MKQLILAMGALVAVAGCESTATPAAAGQPKLSWIQANIFDKSCSNSACHGKGASPSGNLSVVDLETAYGNLVNKESGEKKKDGTTMLRVVPGKPDESLLYLAVSKGYGNTKQMPLGIALEPYQIEAIRGWIAAGAKND